MMIHDARAAANFFIDRATRHSMELTVMTLLKVLYFAHAWHLAKYQRPLIAQPFEAWKHGPVNRVVYEQLKGLGARPISEKLTSFNIENCIFEETPYHFDDETEKFLANIFDYYSRFHAFTLSDLTHEEGSPWHTKWSEAEKRAVPGMVIPNELIMKWFGEEAKRRSEKQKKGYA